MTEPQPAYEAHRDRPCPFCGSEDSIRSTLYVDDEGTELVPAGDIGEIPAVHCRNCLAEAPVHIWNRSPWRYPPDMPKPGTRVVQTYRRVDGGESQPMIAVVCDPKKYAMQPLVRWMEVPA